MPRLTTEQARSVQTWTEQRDALLRDIGMYTTQRNEIKKSAEEYGLLLAQLDKDIENRNGRIAEMDALEIRHKNSVSAEILELEVRKTRLQCECSALDEKMKSGAEKFEIWTRAIGTLESAHVTMKDQSEIVNRVVGEIIQTSQLHTSDMKVMMADIKTISDQVIERGSENVKQTNIVLEKMPKLIFDMQRPIPVRRTYPVGHPNAHKDGATS